MSAKCKWSSVARWALLLLAVLGFAALPQASWQPKNLTGYPIRDILVDPSSPNTMYAATGFGVAKSTNGGATWDWTPLVDVTVNALTFGASGTQEIYAAWDYGVMRSLNGGTTWTDRSTGLPTGDIVRALVRDFAVTGSSVLFAACGSYVYRSDNGGGSWYPTELFATNTGVACLAMDPTNHLVLYAGLNGNGLWKTTTGGTSWTFTGLDSAYIQSFNAIGINPDSPQTVYVSGFFGKPYPANYRTTTGGSPWYPITGLALPVYDWAFLHDLSGQNPTTVYGSCSNGSVYKSSDGLAWSDDSSGLPQATVQCLTLNGYILWAGTQGSGIYYSDQTPCAPTCAASANPPTGTAPLTVNFTASSTGVNCTGSPAFSWTFGDGGTSSLQNPIHTYANPGTFSWALAVTWAGRTCAKAGTVTVTPDCVIHCDAAANPSSGSAPLAVAFTSTVTGTGAGCTGAATYSWSFGDGGSSSLQNPSHTYSAPGTYTWWFSGRLAGLICTRTATVTVTPPCEVTCEATIPAAGVAGASVPFSGTAAATNCVTVPAFTWAFGDGATAVGKDVTHIYTAAGTYSWTLAVTADDKTCVRTGTIVISAPPCTLTCSAGATPATGQAPLAVLFSATGTGDNCTGTPAFSWTFGDGGTSILQNPSHTYPLAGLYSWVVTVTLNGVSCERTGTVTVTPPCTVHCSATVPSGATAGSPVAFYSSATPSNCAEPVAFAWAFGDGGTSAEQSPSHIYTQAGNYTWTLTATSGTAVCTRTGTVAVRPATAEANGSVLIQSGGQSYPLSGVTGSAILEGEQRQTYLAPISGGSFHFSGVPPGTYTLSGTIFYGDFVLEDAQLLTYGCATPAAVPLPKSLDAPRVPVSLSAGANELHIALAPPLVMLHGVLSCYQKWQDWDQAARAAGFFSFTPNYDFTAPWETRASQALSQVGQDLRGIGESGASLPWVLLGHDMGGLLARALASGYNRTDPLVQSLRQIYLLGAPNSGSELLLYGGMKPEDMVLRFNLVYPDFGDKNAGVYAIAGDHGWWGLNNTDGRVSLHSAFNITRMVCTASPFAGTEICSPYTALALESGGGRVVTYRHSELGGESSLEVLTGQILGLLPTLAEGYPESPGGGIIWGTLGRTTGTASGNTQSRSSGESASPVEIPFQISPTDGMGVVALATEGSGLFEILDPSGSLVHARYLPETPLPESEPGLQYTALNPPPGSWKLRVTPTGGSLRYSAVMVEDSLFGISAYLLKKAYAPGETVVARLDRDVTGNPGSVSFTGASLLLKDEAGGLLQTVILYDDGLHGDGLAGDGSFGGAFTAPSAVGAYPIEFRAAGIYQGKAFHRTSVDWLQVIPSPVAEDSARIFAGVFSDMGVDLSGTGRFDAIAAMVRLNLPSSGHFVLLGDLYDSEGRFLAHAVVSQDTQAAGVHDLFLTFPLPAAACSLFDHTFSVRNLEVVDGNLLTLDLWTPGVTTASYAAADFSCAPGPASLLKITALYPDEGSTGRIAQIQVSGSGFAAGVTISFDGGISVNGATRVNENLINASISIPQSALTGARTLTVDNGDGDTATAPAAFTVTADQPPSVTIQAPAASATLQGIATVSAAASDDYKIVQVDFTIDGNPAASLPGFPFRFDWDTRAAANGPHTIGATATDDIGQRTSASVAVSVNNPVVPGDCDGDRTVSIAEVQRAISMFLGTQSPACGVDCNGDGTISIGEVQKVINVFLGNASSC